MTKWLLSNSWYLLNPQLQQSFTYCTLLCYPSLPPDGESPSGSWARAGNSWRRTTGRSITNRYQFGLTKSSICHNSQKLYTCVVCSYSSLCALVVTTIKKLFCNCFQNNLFLFKIVNPAISLFTISYLFGPFLAT